MGVFDFESTTIAPRESSIGLNLRARPQAGAIEFFLPGRFFTYREKRQTKKGRCPVPKGRGKQARIVPGKGFATITENPATRSAEKALIEALLPLVPTEPWEGAIRMDVTFVFVPPLKPRWQYEASIAGFIHPSGDNLGDRDNLHKLLADAMEKAGFYVKDSRLVKGLVEKAYGEVPGYKVRMELLREPQTLEEWKQWPNRP